jgi:hypothetical protein
VVRRQPAKLLLAGSIPARASNFFGAQMIEKLWPSFRIKSLNAILWDALTSAINRLDAFSQA